jgi:uncharacterized delta-60 repeat protein
MNLSFPRLRSLLALLGALLLALFVSAPIRAQNANDGFDPNANDVVNALAVQTDGKLIVGGNFTQIAGQPRAHLARLLVDGSLDPGFAATVVDAPVIAIAVQADGRILIDGYFTTVGGQTRNYIARLNANGSVDNAFHPVANNTIDAMAVQADGRIVVAGNFTEIGGQARNYIARLNADGSLDSTFNPNANSRILAMTMQARGRIVIGGNFTALGAQTRNRIARLNADGSLDATFDPDANDTVFAIALQPDGHIVIGGGFTTLGGQTRNRVARLEANGSLDATFDPNADGAVRVLAVHPDGRIVIGGHFSNVGGHLASHVAWLDADGSFNTAFHPGANGAGVNALAVQPDGRLVLGGSFTWLGGQTRNYIARVNADGSWVDSTFNPGADKRVFSLALQPDGDIVAGGTDITWVIGRNPGTLGGTEFQAITRVTSSGITDSAFIPPYLLGVIFYTLALQPDSRLLFGGRSDQIDDLQRRASGRLDAGGSLDQTFNPDLNSFDTSGYFDLGVYAICIQPDGRILVGGAFNAVGGDTRHHITRLDAHGSIDPTFYANADGPVYAIALQPDGRIVIGGYFFNVDGQRRYGIARLNDDGSLDPAFNPPSFGDFVNSLAVQPDGRIATASDLHIGRLNADGSVDATFHAPEIHPLEPPLGTSVGGVAALGLQADGRIVIGGIFTIGEQAGHNIARLDVDGSLDATFVDPYADSEVYALAFQADGRIVVGGAFTTIGGQSRDYVARLSTPEAALQSLTLISYSRGGSMVTWLRSGAGPELVLPPQLLFSQDGHTYAEVGTMQRIAGGWRYTGFSPPSGQPGYLRVRGRASSGEFNGSGGLIESTLQFGDGSEGIDGVFASGFE